MGKEKRKGRLNKGEAGEFLGFAAFAVPTAAPSNDAIVASKPGPQLSPIYTGSDQTLQALFPRIGQKRDATTKCKALQELNDFLSNPDIPKKSQIEALGHFFYLLHSKLHYDNAPQVRAAALTCCQQAVTRLPKATAALGEQQPELWGMMWSPRADPSTQVRLAAEAIPWATNNTTTEGVWDYCQRILSYGKATTMHEELFQKKASGSSSSNSQTLSDRQAEELEERFERIVGTALGGLTLLLLFRNDNSDDNNVVGERKSEDVRYLWKSTMSSPKYFLRRKTYELLSTCCQRAPGLVDCDKVPKLLAQMLAAEKEPTNIHVLLETLLAYVVHMVNKEDRFEAMNTTFLKPLSKLFSKGCHGATQWGPTVLPIVALFPPDSQPGILTSVWEGRTHVVGVSEQLQIAMAVAETAAFCLGKAPHDLSQVMGKCWLNALTAYLTMEEKASLRRVLEPFRQTLAKNLHLLGEACATCQETAIFSIRDWFWDTEMPAVLHQTNIDNLQLASLIRLVPPKDAAIAYMLPAITGRFLDMLESCRSAADKCPTMDMYEILLAGFKHFSANQLVQNVDKFIMNDLLGWMVRHTSSLSERKDDAMANRDFQVLKLCIPFAIPSIWDSILRELVAAKCDFHSVVHGMVVLAEDGGSELLKSTVLNDLCVQAARDSVAPLGTELNDDESESTEIRLELYHKTADLLQACAGLGEVQGGSLVGESVIQVWLDLACPKDFATALDINPVLETLILMVSNGALYGSDLDRVLVQSWRLGGSFWEETILPWLGKNESSLVRLLELLSKESQAVLRQSVSESKIDDVMAQMWSERAHRILTLCSSESPSIPTPSLSVVGLDNIQMWKRNESYKPHSFLVQSLLRLLEMLTDSRQRWQLLSNTDVGNTMELLVPISLCLSGASSGLLQSETARRREDAFSRMLFLLGKKEIPADLVADWISETISSFAAPPTNGAGESRLRQRTNVLSQLIELRLRHLLPPRSTIEDEIVPEKLQKGDQVWYIPDTQNGSACEECRILKIHTDLPGELYFTIGVNGQERQTVGSRLRLTPAPVSSVYDSPVDVLPAAEVPLRIELTERILRDILNPTSETFGCETFEMVALVVSQVGLVGERGVGSSHYEISKQLTAIQDEVVSNLDDFGSNKDCLTKLMWQLAYSMGFGWSIPPFPHCISLLGIDPTRSVTAINTHYATLDGEVAQDGVDVSALAWLSVAVPHLNSKVVREQTTFRIFQLASRVLGTCKIGFNDDDFTALRAIQCAQEESHKFGEGESLCQDTETEAIVKLVAAFVERWPDRSTEANLYQTGPESWYHFSVTKRVLDSTLQNRPSMLALAARQYSDGVARGLFTKHKRKFAMGILEKYAITGIPLHQLGTGMNSETQAQVDLWKKDLIDSETEELEEDIENVVQWIPARVLNELEGWQGMASDSHDQDVICGRMLCWLVFLQIFDVAAAKDSYNRPALTSYVSKCHAVDSILKMALVHANISSDRKGKVDEVFEVDDILKDEDVDLSKLALLCLFRTVEVLPTLSKNWWETECPSYLSQAVCEFVEMNVSPEIMRRELKRIRKEMAHGEMQVKGSSISREVTATYKQDDFTLKVVIKIPPSFPFRRAEVDCSKTLGIPESRWKRWSLQITQMLNNQGGTLKDALMLWKENVDKEFEGVEPCPVCYSVLHVKTHKLPELECKTCHNRFHLDCLTQWFRSSGKSACVICQQPWSGTRIK